MSNSPGVLLAVDSRCTHGEGVLWCDRRAVLYWIDISEQQLWQHDPASGATRFWRLPDRPGCLGLLEDGRLLLVLAKSILVASPDVAEGEPLTLAALLEVEADNPHTRSNDGRADRHGNFVFGTMDEAEHKTGRGAFYQFSLRHGLRQLPLGGVSIPNSICFSLDGHTMYYCDSVRPQIMCCDYDPDTATTGNTRLFATLDRLDAEPDGSIIDSEGHLWNAQWRASRVVRYRPDGGVALVMPMPVKNPTCCAFGGKAQDTLYTISSRLDHAEHELADTPNAGSLFAFTGIGTGLPESRVASR